MAPFGRTLVEQCYHWIKTEGKNHKVDGKNAEKSDSVNCQGARLFERVSQRDGAELCEMNYRVGGIRPIAGADRLGV
jgi:hypothetical protein